MSAPADDGKHWLEPPEWWKKSKPLRWVPILIGIGCLLVIVQPTVSRRLAARRALEALGLPVDSVLLDGKWDFVGDGTSHLLVKGDARCLSIAAASILAKVTRDRIMREEAEHHPYWAFELNKGYPCPKHKTALQGIGPSAIHRRSWVFMDTLPWGGVRRIVRPDPQGTLFD